MHLFNVKCIKGVTLFRFREHNHNLTFVHYYSFISVAFRAVLIFPFNGTVKKVMFNVLMLTKAI